MSDRRSKSNQLGSIRLACVTDSVEQTMAVGEAIGRLVRSRDVIALDGELGAGKTQFVRGLSVGMGLDAEAVSSPTFVLMHEYLPEVGRNENALVLVHIDAYRLEGGGDLHTLGWDDGGDGPGELADGAVVVVEWAARIGSDLPADRLDVMIEHAGESQRRLVVEAHGSWAERNLSSALWDFVDRSMR